MSAAITLIMSIAAITLSASALTVQVWLHHRRTGDWWPHPPAAPQEGDHATPASKRDEDANG